MGRSKSRTASKVTTMTLAAILIVFMFYYWYSNRMPKEEAVVEPTEMEQLLNRDLSENYPETPREVVDFYSKILKQLYSDIEDEKTEILALKIRELYDEELLSVNPEKEYLTNLYTDIAVAKKAERRITYYYMVDEEDKITVVDSKEYATVKASYTIQEKGKVSEGRRFLLRKDDEGRWKILGWETFSE